MTKSPSFALNQAITLGSDLSLVGSLSVYNLGTFTFDLATVIAQNHASTSNDNIFP